MNCWVFLPLMQQPNSLFILCHLSLCEQLSKFSFVFSLSQSTKSWRAQSKLHWMHNIRERVEFHFKISFLSNFLSSAAGKFSRNELIPWYRLKDVHIQRDLGGESEKKMSNFFRSSFVPSIIFKKMFSLMTTKNP